MTVDPSTTEGAEQEPVVTPESVAEGDSPNSADTSVSDAKGTPADSSSADGTETKVSTEGDKKPTSVLGAIEAALKTDKPAADSPTADKGKQVQEDAAEADKSKDEAAKDADLPFHKHPRWQAMVAERDQYKAKQAEYEDSHQAVTRLETFLNDNRLSVDEFNTLLQVGALMRNDPHKALEALAPYYQGLLQVTGALLPADLQQDVEAGIISENYAKELAQTRAKSVLSQQRVERTEQRTTEQETGRRMEALATSASAWERQWAGSDPDYSKKSVRVQEMLELRWRRGDVPKTEAEVVSQCEDVKKAVDKELRGLLPRKQAIGPGPDAGAAGTHSSAQPPKTLMEAMQRAVGG